VLIAARIFDKLLFPPMYIPVEFLNNSDLLAPDALFPYLKLTKINIFELTDDGVMVTLKFGTSTGVADVVAKGVVLLECTTLEGIELSQLSDARITVVISCLPHLLV
tara:strand:+ start:1000 stop:1320 length:321 start_codon:yes stop_codon:yes gene_type:complete